MSTAIETLAIGDELLVGKISDTNSQFVAKHLFSSGLRLSRQTVVADDNTEIVAAIEATAQRARVVIVFGGLGPTSDDKTAECVAGILGCKVVEDSNSKTKLLEFLKKRGREATAASLKQVLYPQKTTPIPNSKGLAPGFQFKLSNCQFYFLPGVPMEMEAMYLDFVLPEIKIQMGASQILSHTWRCIEIHESRVQDLMDPIESQLPAGCYLGYRTSFPENHLTLYWADKSGREGFVNTQSQIRNILAPWCYTEADKDLEQVVVENLMSKKATLVLAESCTGGLTTQRLSRVAGASNVLWGGYTSYQIQAKKTMLEVELKTTDDAVSRECTEQLAEKAKTKSGCSLSASVTGYMGPTGGERDPIGTVYLCVKSNTLHEKKVEVPIGDRLRAQWGASSYLLRLIQQSIQSAAK